MTVWVQPGTSYHRRKEQVYIFKKERVTLIFKAEGYAFQLPLKKIADHVRTLYCYGEHSITKGVGTAVFSGGRKGRPQPLG